MAKAIVCEICGKSGFKNAAGLAGHKKIVHGGGVKVEMVENSAPILDSIETLRGDLQGMQKRFEALEQRSPHLNLEGVIHDLQGLSSEIKSNRHTTTRLARTLADVQKKVESAPGRIDLQTLSSEITAGLRKELKNIPQSKPVQKVHRHIVSSGAVATLKKEKNVPSNALSKPSSTVDQEEGFAWGTALLVVLGFLGLRALNQRTQPEQSLESALQSAPSSVVQRY